jgi:hypothetical protein
MIKIVSNSLEALFDSRFIVQASSVLLSSERLAKSSIQIIRLAFSDALILFLDEDGFHLINIINHSIIQNI